MTINTRDYGNIFFGSDFHCFHDKNFLFEPRNCADKESHTRMVIDGINKQAGEDDLIIHLGDLVLTCDYEDMLDMLLEIKCRNIWFIIGNHDTRIKRLLNNLSRYNPYDLGDLTEKEKLIYDSKSLIDLGKYEEIVIREPSREKGKKDYKKEVTLCHYPFIVWHDSHKGTFSLCGHSHGSLMDSSLEQTDAKRLDVGVDNALAYSGNVMFNWDQIKSIMKFKSGTTVDHHNRDTT